MDNIKEKISGDIKTAMKSRDKLRTSVLRMVMSEINVAEKSGNDFKHIDILKGYSKKIKKSIEEYKKLSLEDKILELNSELEIVNEYLPKEMSDEELTNAVDDILKENDFKSGEVGKAIKAVMAKYGDVADGRKVQSIVKEKLS